MIAFAIDNKDNVASWGKYELDELQFAYAELPEQDRTSTTGQRIKARIEELESGKDHLQEIKQEQIQEYPLDDTEQEAPAEPPITQATGQPAAEAKNNTPFIIGGIVVAIIILLLALYFF